ncbi:MAG: glycosyltransferase family 39 protein, partial [Bdellovibrionales bacterium]|nr:glycosyltransferase family 39 protein [Bdellovibrionales bacterium]
MNTPKCDCSESVWNWLAPVLVLSSMILSLAVCAYFHTGFYASDDISYLDTIFALSKGERFEAGLGNVRLPLLLIPALVFRLSGGSIFLTTFVGNLYPPLIVLMTYLLGTYVQNRKVGAIASGFVALSPLTYCFSGGLLPDNALTFWMMVWCVFLVRSFSCEEADGGEVQSFRFHYVFLAGLANGIAYLTKESGLILAVPAGIALLSTKPLLSWPFASKQKWKALILYGFGLGACFVLELLVLRIWTGHFVYRLGIATNTEWLPHLLQRMQEQGTNPWDRILFAFNLVSLLTGKLILLLGFGAALIYPLLKGKFRILPLVPIWLFSYHTLGSVSFSQYVTPVIVNRYYIIVIPFLSICFAAVAFQLLSWSLRAVAFWLKHESTRTIFAELSATGIIVIFGLYVGYERALATEYYYAGKMYRGAEVKAFLTALGIAQKEYPELPIVLSYYTSSRMYPLWGNECPRQDIYFLRHRENCNKRTKPEPPLIFLSINNTNFDAPPEEAITKLVDPSRFRIPSAPRLIPAPGSRFQEIRQRNFEALDLPPDADLLGDPS